MDVPSSIDSRKKSTLDLTCLHGPDILPLVLLSSRADLDPPFHWETSMRLLLPSLVRIRHLLLIRI
jgi:hypothetical protein